MHVSVTLPENATNTSNATSRLVAVDKVVLNLSRRILTRGGRDERPTFALEELRRHEIKLWDDENDLTRLPSLAPLSSRTSARQNQIEDGRKHLQLPAGGQGIDIRLEMPLQTVEITPQGRQTVPARDFGLSLRTPNIEAEVSNTWLQDIQLELTPHHLITVHSFSHSSSSRTALVLRGPSSNPDYCR